MAIKVIKHGEKVFKKVCPICGCEFEYEYEDLEGYCGFNKHVKCPDCGEYLEHKESQEKKDITWIDKEARDKMFYVDFQNPAVLWTHNQWPDCETCPNKPDPNKPVFGDTPCTWCPKNRPYCTCTTGEFKVDGLNNDLKLTSTVSGEYSTAFSADSTETKDKK